MKKMYCPYFFPVISKKSIVHVQYFFYIYIGCYHIAKEFSVTLIFKFFKLIFQRTLKLRGMGAPGQKSALGFIFKRIFLLDRGEKCELGFIFNSIFSQFQAFLQNYKKSFFILILFRFFYRFHLIRVLTSRLKLKTKI